MGSLEALGPLRMLLVGVVGLLWVLLEPIWPPLPFLLYSLVGSIFSSGWVLMEFWLCGLDPLLVLLFLAHWL